MTNHIRQCPTCHKDIIHTGKHAKYNLEEAVRKNRLCISCCQIGKKLSEEIRKKISKNSAKFWLGKHFSEEFKQKMSDNSKKQLPYIRSEETKRKHRIAILKRLKKLGIVTCEDEGAKKWIDKYNKETNSNFQPKTFWKWGYRADGYDASRVLDMIPEDKREALLVEYLKRKGSKKNNSRRNKA